MSIEELEVSGIPDWVVLFGDLRIFQEIKSIIIKHGGSQEDVQKANDKLVYICSNKNIQDKNLEKPLNGNHYKKRHFYESRLFDHVQNCKDFRLVYIKFPSRVDPSIWKIRLVGIFTHKEVKQGIPAKSKFPMGESLDEKDLKFFSYILGDDYEL